MTTFSTSGEGTEPGGRADAVVRQSSRQDTFEALALLLGVLGILLVLALTMGASLPIGQ